MMNENYQLTLKGKVVEILDKEGKCYVRLKLEPPFLEMHCGINKDLRLEDEVTINVEIKILSLSQQSENQINN